ncbi:MAG: hypothetical protein JXX29_12270 [Deltaproteobacteria bacterium]|nr:hypothetical protein [Deltaproteobacteria bacterium]MBN2672449.1 hypothetical protein [Deltaproteobacteria bacterium]
MSFVKWITGGTFESNRDEGEQLFSNEDFGEAKLAYQRALKKAKGVQENEIAKIRQKIADCNEALAQKRIDAAREYFEAGDVERALEFLEDVLLICDTDDMANRVDACREDFVKAEARAMSEEHEMSEEELLAVISGAWSAAQAQEFSNYTELFYQGIIKGHDGEHREAVDLLSSVLADEGAEGVFIHLELGRQQLLAEDIAAGQESLETFVAKCPEPDQAKDELVVAYNLLANIYIKEERFDAAEDALMKAYRTAPENHLPLLNLGIFLRERGEFERSKRTLENAMDTMGAMHPDMRVFRELGHTHMAMDKKQEAREFYQAVVDHCCQRGIHEQYDPEAALPLARLLEEENKLREACDIYRHLANGYDKANFFEYNIESARLLAALKEKEGLVAQYLASAAELAQTESQKERLLALENSLQRHE